MDSDADGFLRKAEESLAGAEREFAAGAYNNAANRCYYACFQAAAAALLAAGLQPPGQWSHRYVQSQFVGQLIARRKLYPSELRAVLIDSYNLRISGDYRPGHVTRASVAGAEARARAFVAAVRERLRG